MRLFKIAEFMLKERPWPWNINILEGVNPNDFAKAKNDAEEHTGGKLPALRPTEKNPAWVLLYEHIKSEQINPDDIRRMSYTDLGYLTGMSKNPPGVNDHEATKLRENVTRASTELSRRNLYRVSLVSALIGALFGFAATIVTIYFT